MELIYKIGITFIFSSLFVSFILLLYYKLDNNLNIEKSKFIYTVILVGFIHSVIQNIIPTLFFPFFFIIFPALVLALAFNIKLLKSFKTLLKLFSIMYIIETLIFLTLKFLLDIDASKLDLNSIVGLISILPIKAIELTVVIILKRRNLKWDFYFLEKLLKIQKK